MKLLILASIIAFSLIGIVGVQESFAEQASGKPAWDTSGEKVCGDELCPQVTCTAEDHKKPFIPPLTRGMHGPFPRVADLHGNSVDVVRIGEQITIRTDLANGKDCIQPYVWIIQIKEPDGSVVFLGWLSGIMDSNQFYSQSVSWIPEIKSTYTITMFVWESLDNLFPIHPPATTILTVDDAVSKLELKNKYDVINGCTDVGVWLDEFNECESPSATESFENYCSDYGGTHYSCHSGCRHSPDWPNSLCAAQCFAVCEFED